MMNTYRDAYAVQVINRKKAGRPPKYLKGFNTRPEAENKMKDLCSKETYAFKVVYIREYFNHEIDHGAFASNITEIPEYYSI